MIWARPLMKSYRYVISQIIAKMPGNIYGDGTSFQLIHRSIGLPGDIMHHILEFEGMRDKKLFQIEFDVSSRHFILTERLVAYNPSGLPFYKSVYHNPYSPINAEYVHSILLKLIDHFEIPVEYESGIK